MKRFDGIVIVSDLDGTLLRDDKRPGERNLRAIEYFKANGGNFAVATGRVAGLASYSVPELSQLVNMLSVTCNGACLYDFRTGKAPIVHRLDFELIKDIVAFVHSICDTAGTRASAAEYVYVCPPEDKDNYYIKKDFAAHAGMPVHVAPVEEWESLTLMKIVVRLPAEELPRVMRALDERYGERVSLAQSWSTIIDIQPAGINKGGSFVEYVKSELGENKKIYACGDYLNDKELLEAADVSVCPSTAHEDIIKLCDLCLCSNNDGLIADLVEHIERELGK